jgi:hypothetical protein
MQFPILLISVGILSGSNIIVILGQGRSQMGAQLLEKRKGFLGTFCSEFGKSASIYL